MSIKHIETVVEHLGSKAEFARFLGVTPSFAGRVARGIQTIPATKCRDIEYLMDGVITAEQLRPDVFKPAWYDT